MISVYVDLALGLILAFLLLSLLVSGINEGIVRLFAIRSKFLWAYLRDTMDGAPAEGRSWLPSGVAGVFAKLPLTRMGVAEDPRPMHEAEPSPSTVEPMPDDPAKASRSEEGGERPGGAEQTEGTVPAVAGTPHETPAAPPDPRPEAVPVDMTERLYERLREIDHPKGRRTSIADIPPSRFGVAVMEMVSAEHGGVEGFLRKLEEIGSPLHGHLSGVWRSAANDLEGFRKGTEEWFDGEMKRLSLLYRRYVRWVVATLGLVIVLLLSIDALEYGKMLLRDNGYRAGVAAIAGDAGGLDALRARCGTAGETDPYACVTESFSSPALVQIFEHSIVSLRLPEEGAPGVSLNFSTWADRVLTPAHWPGFLLSFVALLFGASFWWDLLRRLTGFRGRL